MSESINAEFEAYVAKELGDIAVVSEGRYISPKIQNYYKVWNHQQIRITELEALCLNALYHHQGASSAVGQPIRKALGMGEFDRITEAQLKIIHNVRAPYAAIAEGKQA